MKLVDGNGNPVNFEHVEPYTTFAETNEGVRFPILRVTYGPGNRISFTWADKSLEELREEWGFEN